MDVNFAKPCNECALNLYLFDEGDAIRNFTCKATDGDIRAAASQDCSQRARAR